MCKDILFLVNWRWDVGGADYTLKRRNMNFNDFDWHDAIIKKIELDRNNPGNCDEVKFEIIWPNGEIVDFVFEKVYWTSMKLNFGIVAEETILEAIQLDEQAEELTNLYFKWKGILDDVKLNTYKIGLNSTGGEIKIIAKSFVVKRLK
jgi:hypothetical protein